MSEGKLSERLGIRRQILPLDRRDHLLHDFLHEGIRVLGPVAQADYDQVEARDHERVVVPRSGSLDQVFAAVQKAEGFYVVRGTKSIKPTIRRAYDDGGQRLRHLEGKRLSWEILPRQTVDLDIAWEGSEGGTYHGRLVAIYRPAKRNRKTYVYLHTNLARETFPPFDVGQLYRLRWQVELLFKEWKSHANLPTDSIRQCPPSPQGLIWASLAAATLKRVITHTAEQTCGIELSTQRGCPAPANISSTESSSAFFVAAAL